MHSPTRSGRLLDLCFITLLLTASACSSGVPAGIASAPAPAVASGDSSPVPRSKPKSRAQAKSSLALALKPTPFPADSTALERTVIKEHAHWPLALALARRSGNPEVAEEAAAALVYEAARLRLSPSLLGAVLLIENTPLDPAVVSSQGAIGLMQVMPVHRGSYGCSPDLVKVETNICHGASILKHMVRRTKSMPLALKRYNGCVRSRNTPRCHRYPGRVLRTASRLRAEILLIAADSSIGYKAALASTSRKRSGSPRPQLAISADSVGTESSTPPISCASFFGCLRHRWTLKY